MAFEKGNKLGGRPKERRMFDETLRRAIAQDDGARVRACAEALLDKAAAGEPWAVNCLADRLDGKPDQNLTVTRDVKDLSIDELLAAIAAERAARPEASAAKPSELH
jgi:hypothetical protein